MTNLMAEHLVKQMAEQFVSIMSCSLVYSRKYHLCWIYCFHIYLYFLDIQFSCSYFRVKIANGNYHLFSFAYLVDEFTQAFLEMFPDGSNFSRDYQGRSVSSKGSNFMLIQLYFGVASSNIHSGEGCWCFFFYDYSCSCVFIRPFYSTVIACVLLLTSTCLFYCTFFDVCFS